MLGENLQTIRENTEIFIKTSKDIGLEVNSDKTKYMITSRQQNVHRYGASGCMRACHAAGQGSIPGRDKFPGWVFFEVFPHL